MKKTLFRNSVVSILSVGLTVLFVGCQQQAAPQQNSNSAQNPPAADIAQTTSGKSYDPCLLLTSDDVKAVFPDGVVTNTKHDTTPNVVGQKICYYSASDTDMKFISLSIIQDADISTIARTNGRSAGSLYNGEKALVGGTQEVPGIGDAAYFGGNGLKIGAGLSVLVKSRGVKFTIDLGLGFGNTDAQKHIDLEKQLAQKVMSRL